MVDITATSVMNLELVGEMKNLEELGLVDMPRGFNISCLKPLETLPNIKEISAADAVATELFVKIHKKKKAAHDHHDIHFLARELDEWLPKSIASLQEGRYSPSHLRRWQFSDETVDSLTIPDRILQHVLLKELKPTFKHVMNPNCYHLSGPSGVKLASDRVFEALNKPKGERPLYVIRADVKSYYTRCCWRCGIYIEYKGWNLNDSD